MEPTADLSNIYLAWWDSYLYNNTFYHVIHILLFLQLNYKVTYLATSFILTVEHHP